MRRLDGDKVLYHVLQASSKTMPGRSFQYGSADIILESGDYADEMAKICRELKRAQEHAANETQKLVLEQYIESFETGDLEVYRDSQRTWIRDLQPKVENIFGFVEPYRDPFGTRAEFEGLVAITDKEESKALTRLVENSDKFIRRLPWAAGAKENDGKGPFEKSLFQPPDFGSVHDRPTTSGLASIRKLIFAALAYCSSIIFPGINLPNVSSPKKLSFHIIYAVLSSITTSAKHAGLRTSSLPTE
jgi:dipeptidyl-peptidase III